MEQQQQQQPPPPPPPTLPNTLDRHRRPSRRRHQPLSLACSSDGSLCFSDSGEDDQTFRSGASYEECRLSEIELCSSECLSEIDVESGELEREVHYYGTKMKKKKRRRKRECRICHLNLVGHEEEVEYGVGIELGCDCKGDLGAAHKHCADTWFKIRGNLTCEICGATAVNVTAEQTAEANTADGVAADLSTTTTAHSEIRSSCSGRRIMNVLLGCMAVAFITSWLFHFHVLP